MGEKSTSGETGAGTPQDPQSTDANASIKSAFDREADVESSVTATSETDQAALVEALFSGARETPDVDDSTTADDAVTPEVHNTPDDTDDGANNNGPGHDEGGTDSDSAGSEAATSDDQDAPQGFAALGLKRELLAELTKLGYEEPTPIQRQAIPELINGMDIIGQAATGTGKTAAFALPILNSINADTPARPVALIVVPTRELAVQVSEAIFKYGRGSRVKVVPVFGGQPIQRQLKALDRGVHVVIATPGRAIDHIKRRSLDLRNIRTVVLDEADEMLDMGFTEDIESILDATPEDRQTVLFSATMPPRIERIAKKYLQDPITVKIGAQKSDSASPLVRQTVYMVLRSHKASALGRILDIESPTAAIVFCRTRTEVDELTVTMNGRGYRADALHGGMDQKQRDRVMARLRDGSAELLVATDVAARGLDVDSLTHVINYDVPSAPESYVHRIGRVGRAGREGVAITIAEPKQRRLLKNIERLTKQTIKVEKVPTVADMRTRQIEMTVGSVAEAIAADDLEDYAKVFDTLSDEHEPRAIALAAIKLVHSARGATLDEQEIPDASGSGQGKGDKKRKNRDDRQSFNKRGRDNRSDERDGSSKRRERSGRGHGGDGDTGYVYVSVGKGSGVRPGDLVGAIANESGLTGADIGPIRISEHYAVVGVPANEVETVVSAMRSTSIRGKRAKVRKFED